MSNDNTTPELENEATEQAALQAFSVADLDDDRPMVEKVTLTLPDGRLRELHVRRLTGEEAIDVLTAAAAQKNRIDVSVMKMKRCLVAAEDHTQPLFSDKLALDIAKKKSAEWLAAFLAAIHEVNPLIKNA